MGEWAREIETRERRGVAHRLQIDIVRHDRVAHKARYYYVRLPHSLPDCLPACFNSPHPTLSPHTVWWLCQPARRRCCSFLYSHPGSWFRARHFCGENFHLLSLTSLGPRLVSLSLALSPRSRCCHLRQICAVIRAATANSSNNNEELCQWQTNVCNAAEIYSTTFIVVVAYVVCVTICAFCQESWIQPGSTWCHTCTCVRACVRWEVCSISWLAVVCFLICPRRLSTCLLGKGGGVYNCVFAWIFVRLIALINTNRSMLFENHSRSTYKSHTVCTFGIFFVIESVLCTCTKCCRTKAHIMLLAKNSSPSLLHLLAYAYALVYPLLFTYA